MEKADTWNQRHNKQAVGIPRKMRYYLQRKALQKLYNGLLKPYVD